MADPIDFYFDFSSPYGYLASQVIDELAASHGRTVIWRPFLLGAVFKQTGSAPLVSIPLKGEYAKRDLPRTARLMNLPLDMTPDFPFMSVAACRAFYWLCDRDRETANALAKRLLRAAFGEARSIAKAESVIEFASEFDLDTAELGAALQDPAVKERLRQEVDAAIERGVFGSPYIFVDGEPFWGVDHLPQVERWMETGGW